MLGMVGLLIAFVLLIVMAMRGVPILLIGLVCSAIVALTSGMNIYDTLVGAYMSGYIEFFGSNFLIFLAGALFGRMMEITLGANSVADFVVKKLGRDKAVVAIVLSCFILAYGGVSVFVVGFTIYPIAVSLFREADLPRAYLPGTIGFGSVTFAMTSPHPPNSESDPCGGAPDWPHGRCHSGHYRWYFYVCGRFDLAQPHDQKGQREGDPL